MVEYKFRLTYQVVTRKGKEYIGFDFEEWKNKFQNPLNGKSIFLNPLEQIKNFSFPVHLLFYVVPEYDFESTEDLFARSFCPLKEVPEVGLRFTPECAQDFQAEFPNQFENELKKLIEDLKDV